MVKSKRSKFIPNYGEPHTPEIRAKYGYLGAVVSIIGNIVLFIIKLFLGLFINSLALIADAVHSLSDVVSSAVVILGFRISKKPPDEEHPFGHERFEYISTIFIASVLIIVGIDFIFQAIERASNLEAIVNQQYVEIIIVIVIATVVVKELMARYSYAISKKIKSDVLKADAWHHRTDAFSSIGVAISLIGSKLGYPIFDPIFAVIVAIIIIYVGIELIRDSSNFLMGMAPDAEIVNKITKIAKSTNGIKGVHKIFVHDYGTMKVVTLHAEADSDLILEDAHDIADRLENKIHEQTKYPSIIHLEPKKSDCNHKETMKTVIDVLKSEKDVVSFNKLQIIRISGVDNIKMHLIVDNAMSVEKTHELSHRIQEKIQEKCGECILNIHFVPIIKEKKI